MYIYFSSSNVFENGCIYIYILMNSVFILVTAFLFWKHELLTLKYVRDTEI